MSILPVLFDWRKHLTNPGNISTALNILGAIVLFFALLPPFFDTKKSRKTFPIGEKFFRFYMFGSIFMFVNAVFMSIKEAVSWSSVDQSLPLIIMFSTFIITNGTSIYLNTYMWRVKKTNLNESAKLGISEQEYWEKYLSTGE